MSPTKTCPKCHAELPENAPAGICPTCLMQAGMASAPDAGADPQIKATTAASGFVPPTLEELGPLFPQLEILELLGTGGMGAVFKARQPGLDRLVALKILPPEIGREAAFAERFQREARALAKLSHPHIVAVYDFGRTADLYYIMMEFVDGANLRLAGRSGGLSPAAALAIVPQICEALQFAHDEGVVHRDIKPENILIDRRGRVKIADFGLAKLLGTGASDHSLTATHQVMGTLRYMAPEQMQGAREVDHRADIYSLGVVFYELLTGELPMGKFAPPSKKVHIDVRLDEVVLRALEQDPEQRYQHASEVKSELDTIAGSRQPAKDGAGDPSRSARDAAAADAPSLPFTIDEKIHWGLFGEVQGKLRLEKDELLVEYEVRSVFPAFRSGVREVRIPFDSIESIALDVWDVILCTKGMKDLAGIPTSSQGKVTLNAGCWDLEAPGAIEDPAKNFVKRLQRRLDGSGADDESSDTSAARSESAMGAADSVRSGHSSSRVSERGTRPLRALPGHTTGWTVLFCLLGLIAVPLTWVSVQYPDEPSVLGRGFHSIEGRICAGAFLGGILCVIAIGRGSALSVLRPLILCIIGITALSVAWHAVYWTQLRPTPVSWWMTYLVDGAHRQGFISQIEIEIGFMLSAVSALGLLFVSAVEFRGVVRRRRVENSSGPSVVPPAGQGTGTSPNRHPFTGREGSARPKLVPVFATMNLLGAIVLMLVCAMDDSASAAESAPRLWQVWETVDAVLGFTMAAGMFAASIGLFLWKSWARRLALGVCVFGLASFVFDAPYLARFAIPNAYAEVQGMLIAEGVDPDVRESTAMLTVAALIGGVLLVGLTWLIGQLVYFTRPRVVAAFETPEERPGLFIDRLFSGAGAIAGVVSVFGPLALLLGIAAMWPSPNGATARLRLALNPQAVVTLNNESVAVTEQGIAETRLRPGDYEVVGLKEGRPIVSSIHFIHSGVRITIENREADAMRITGPLTVEYAPGSSQPTVADFTAIQGRWEIVTQVKGNQRLPGSQVGSWIEFDNDVMRSDVPESPLYQQFSAESRFAINSTAEPRQFDVVGIGARGIYRLDGDTLTLAIADAGRPRPSEFAARHGSMVTLTVCRRAKTYQPDDGVRKDSVAAAGSSSADVEAPSELLRAAALGDASRVQQLLEAGAGVNAKDAAGKTPLMKAVAGGQRPLALTLVLLGADLAAQDQRGQTAIMIAAEKGDTAFLGGLHELSRISFERDATARQEKLRAFPGIERALLAGRDIDLHLLGHYDAEKLTDENGENALMKAARNGSWECVKELATQVDTVLARDKRGRTVLMHAVLGGHVEEDRWLEQFERLTQPPYLGVAGEDNLYVGAMLLFELERSLSVLDKDRKSLLQIAEAHGDARIADILRRHLQMIVVNQTAEIESGGDAARDHYRLRALAWQALGEKDKAEADFKRQLPQ
jgi:uncharacterized protein (TIGR03067 family)